VLIGHAIGFDLSVIQRECERARMVWTPQQALDAGLLTQVAAPYLAGYSLEDVADWLNIEPVDRHSALGDATTTGRIFLGLLSHLREKGVRTLAEADRACRAFANVLDAQRRAGWTEPVSPQPSMPRDRALTGTPTATASITS
jgi:CBS domain-containing protein